MNIIQLLLPKKDVIYEYKDATMRQLVEKINHHGYSSIPILNEDGSFYETITASDLLHRVTKNNTLERMEHIRVQHIPVRRTYKALSISADLGDLLDLIGSQNFIPMVDDTGTFIGIITRSKVMCYLKKKLGQDHVK